MAAIRLGAWLWLLALPLATGQALDPQIEVAPVYPKIEVMWNGTATASWLVTNTGPLDVDVALTLDAGGWVATLDSDALVLQPNAAQVVHASVAPADTNITGGTGPPLTLRATATDAAGRTASADAFVETNVTARPPAVVPPPPPADTTVRDASWAAGAVLLPLLAAYVLLGLLYRVHVPRESVRVLGVHGAWIHIRVRNLAPWTQTVLLRCRRPENGWQVAGDADRVTVPARSEETYTVFVRRLGAVDEPERLRVLVHSRRSALYPWRRHGHITVDSEPIDLSAWSAKKIQAALEDAVVAGA